MPNEQMSTGFDQDALPPGNGVTDLPSPDPDPPVADHQDRRDTADEGEHEEIEDEVDERSKLSFPTSDPPATWAGADRPD
jgi:hypothetical protein